MTEAAAPSSNVIYSEAAAPPNGLAGDSGPQPGAAFVRGPRYSTRLSTMRLAFPSERSIAPAGMTRTAAVTPTRLLM